MLKKICNVCKFEQAEFLNEDGKNYCRSCNSEINNVNNSGLKLDSITLSAHDKILIFDNLRYLLEGLEEYVEKKGYYPNFKRQFQNITISKEQSRNLTVDSAEDFFKTNLLIFVAIIKDTPDFIAKGELRDEFYKWINVVGIDVDNCSDEKLKHFLVEINNVLEGNGKKIVNQTQEYLDNEKKANPTSFGDDMEGVKKVFGVVHSSLNKSREQAELLKDKTYRDAEIKNKIGGGSVMRGEQAFNRIAGNVASRHGDFHFFKGNNPQQRTNSEIIQDIKKNPQNWRMDEVITEYNDQGEATKREIALIHNSAEVGFNGVIYNWQQPIYLPQKFNQSELAEINQALSISQTPTLIQHYQRDKVNSSANPNSNNRSLGTVAIIGGIIVVASLGIYGVVKKSKRKVK